MSSKPLPIYSICSLSEAPVKHSEFIVDRLGHYLDQHQDLQFPHKHSFHHLVYFFSGTGSHSIDFVHFPVAAGQIYFMVPGQVHSWYFDTKPEGYIVNFSAHYLQALLAEGNYLQQFSFFSGIAYDQVITLAIKEREIISDILESIISENENSVIYKDDMMRIILVQLFIQIERCISKEKQTVAAPYNSLLLRNFQKLIDVHFKDKKLTKDYAALLYVTPNHLNALSKDVTGRSAGELIRDRILLEAKRLLVNAEMTIAQIASELDFVDNSYFSKFFKKYVGISPEMFRKQITKR